MSYNGKNIHPCLQKLEENLFLNEFSPSFVKMILERVCREISPHEMDNYEEVQKRVILWIGEQISVYREPLSRGKKNPRVIVLVGSAGVGKTTTVVKLSILYGATLTTGILRKQVRLIAMDHYCLGAVSRMQTFGEPIDVPVSTVDCYDDPKKLLILYRQDADFILIDTIGGGPPNTELEKMKTILDACPAQTELHLCLQATSKSRDIKEFLKRFEPFKYKSVIITKMDETSRIGNVISVLAEERKSISFITTGPRISGDIERATVTQLLNNLEGDK